MVVEVVRPLAVKRGAKIETGRNTDLGGLDLAINCGSCGAHHWGSNRAPLASSRHRDFLRGSREVAKNLCCGGQVLAGLAVSGLLKPVR